MFYDSGAWCSELKGDINFVINMKMYNVNVQCKCKLHVNYQ